MHCPRHPKVCTWCQRQQRRTRDTDRTRSGANWSAQRQRRADTPPARAIPGGPLRRTAATSCSKDGGHVEAEPVHWNLPGSFSTPVYRTTTSLSASTACSRALSRVRVQVGGVPGTSGVASVRIRLMRRKSSSTSEPMQGAVTGAGQPCGSAGSRRCPPSTHRDLERMEQVEAAEYWNTPVVR